MCGGCCRGVVVTASVVVTAVCVALFTCVFMHVGVRRIIFPPAEGLLTYFLKQGGKKEVVPTKQDLLLIDLLRGDTSLDLKNAKHNEGVDAQLAERVRRG